MNSPNSDKFKSAGHAAGSTVCEMYDKEHGHFENDWLDKTKKQSPVPKAGQEKPFK